MKIRGWNLRLRAAEYCIGILVFIILQACSNGAQFGLPSGADSFSTGVAYNNKVDIVLVVDNSYSMDPYQNNLLVQMPEFVSKLDALKMDYHIAVITSSVSSNYQGGKFIGSPLYLTNTSSGLVSSLQSRIQLGGNGSNTESPLQNFYNLFFSNYITTTASGFLRDEALLAIIALSDDDDKSTISSSSFINSLNTLKPNLPNGQRNWVYNYLGVLDLNSPCRSNLGTVTVGLKHVQLADASGGIKNNICDQSLATATSNIRIRIMNILTDYKLSTTPKVSSIKVTVNGVLVPQDSSNGWSYISSTNVVRFNGTAIPAADAKISVTFDPAGAN